MGYTQHRLVPWHEVMGADGEKIFAFGSVIGESLSGIIPAGGNMIIQSSTVPVGQVWVVLFQAVGNWTRSSGLMQILLPLNSTAIALSQGSGIAQYDSVRYPNAIICVAGQSLRFLVYGIAGDQIYATYNGYAMTIP